MEIFMHCEMYWRVDGADEEDEKSAREAVAGGVAAFFSTWRDATLGLMSAGVLKAYALCPSLPPSLVVSLCTYENNGSCYTFTDHPRSLAGSRTSPST